MKKTKISRTHKSLQIKPNKVMLDVIKYPSSILSNRENQAITNFTDPVVKETVINMVHTMQRLNGVGIAAPQIGWGVKLAVALINKIPIVLINPEIVEHAEEYTSIEEGCLSCPNKTVKILRWAWIKVVYNDLHGNKKWLQVDGINAIILQHEIDHLHGKLIVDYETDGNLSVEKYG